MRINHPYRDYFAIKSLTSGYDHDNSTSSDSNNGFAMFDDCSIVHSLGGRSYKWEFWLSLVIGLFCGAFNTTRGWDVFITLWIVFFIVHHAFWFIEYKSNRK